MKNGKTTESTESLILDCGFEIAEFLKLNITGCWMLDFYRQVPRKPRLVGGDESAQSQNNQI